MEGIHNFIRKAHKAIYGINRCPEPLVEDADPHGKRGAVAVCDVLAALPANLVVQFHHNVIGFAIRCAG
jgi:hypothetical protein